MSKGAVTGQLRRVVRIVGVGALLLAPSAAVIGATVTPASAATEVLVNEPFTGATTASPNWDLPSAPSGSNIACLSAGTTGTPIPNCTTNTDSPGSGALRLTSTGFGSEGGVAYTLSVPTIDGLDATFDAYQYGTTSSPTPADGIGLFLAAANPSDPQPPSAIGSAGGDLGYSAVAASTNGMTFGYLGVGLDVFGNYASTVYEGTGCADPGWDNGGQFPENVSVRGPGNGRSGYCMLASTAANGGLSSGSLDGGAGGTRGSSRVPVEVAINTSASSTTTGSGLVVPANGYAVAFTPIGGSRQTLTGSLPSVAGLGFPSSWYNPATGIPYQITFGWVASTGSDTDVHEITNAVVNTLTGIPPTLSVAVSDSAGGAPQFASTFDYDVAVSNSAAAGTQTDPGPITVTDTVPAGLTPDSGGLGGSGWSCSITGQIVTCSNAGPLASGASLPTLVVPVTDTAAAGTVLTDTAVSSSDDSDPATGKDTVTVARESTSFTASASPASTQYPNTVSLSATGLPASSGTVAFSAGGSTLCSVGVPASGPAACSTAAALAPGAYAVTATFTPGSGNLSGSSSTTSFTITTASTSMTAAASPTSTSFGNVVTLSETGLPTATAGGTVTFSAGGSTLCLATIQASGGASCQTSSALAPGTYTVTASYPGNTDYSATSATTSFAITLIGTSLTASATPSSASFGTAVALSATVTPSAATGTVTFTSVGSTLCSGTISAGSASCSTSAFLAPATYPVTATYGGNTDFAGSSNTTSFVINKASTAITAAASPTTTTYGNAVTLTASGLPSSATGSVTFTAGGSTLCTATPNSSGTASCTTSATLSATTYSVTATYSGNTDYSGSTASTSFTIAKANTAFTASANPSTTTFGNSITLSASGLPASAAGMVSFASGATTLCTAPVSAGSASCVTSAALPVATYPVTATYSGDSNHNGSTASTSFVVNLIPTAFSASANPTPTTFGNAVTLSESGLQAATSGGSVAFSSGGTTLCTATVQADGTASCPTSATLPVGTYPVTASYGGSSEYAASSATTSFVVNLIPTSFTASPAPVSTDFGNAVTLSESGLQSQTAGEAVTFTSGGTTLCVATIGADGNASCVTSSTLSVATYPVTASYGGDAEYAASSAATSFVITQIPTSFTVAAQPAATTYGNGVTLVETGLPPGTSPGIVTFTVGSSTLCAARILPSGGASCATSRALPAGVYEVLAAYPGAADYTSSSAGTTFTIDRAPTSFTAKGLPAGARYGTLEALYANGLPANAGGTVTFVTGGLELCTATVVAGRASCTATTALLPATYTATAAYSGDHNHLPSRAEATFQVVAGYWLEASDGGVFTFGTARFHGSTESSGFDLKVLGAVVAMAPTPDASGYWLVTNEGQILGFGTAFPLGDLFTLGKAGHLGGPVVGVASTPDGRGYWIVGADGAVYGFGDAHFFGNIYTIGKAGHLGGPIVGMSVTPDGRGYWLAGADGAVFGFGDARFYGNTYTIGKERSLRAPIVAMSPTPDGRGYWIVGGDGGLFAFGDAKFRGNTYSAGLVGHLDGPVIGMAPTLDGGGYWFATSAGQVLSFGDAQDYGDILTSSAAGHLRGPIVGIEGFPHPFTPPAPAETRRLRPGSE